MADHVPAPRRPWRSPGRGRLVVALAALGVVVLRAPFLTADLGKDEAGYLLIGGHWSLLTPGHSLFGDYWVDRPPLLLTLFGLADRLGGAVPLRVLGILTAVGAVVATADAVDQLTRVARAARTDREGGLPAVRADGPAWRRWSPGLPAACAAVVTAALVVTPATAAVEVNGEVLASPFLALACALTARAVTSGRARPAVLAGAFAVVAVMVKQNLVDGLLWGGVATLASAPALGLRRAARTLLLAAGGGAAALLLTAAWTVLHDTSLSGTWFAMYPFRAAARAVMLAHPSSYAPERRQILLRGAESSGAALVAGLLVVLAVATALDVRHRAAAGTRPRWPVRAAVLATLVTLAWDLVSIDLGGGWWLHYLVEAVVPLGLATGLVADRWPGAGRVLALVTSVSAVTAVVLLGPHAAPPGGSPVGAAVGQVAHRGDTIVTVFGNADVTRASGLSSPYPYLWILPLTVLDPRLHLLVHTLDGPQAPTWFVDFGSTTPSYGPGAPRLRAALRHHYRRVADLDGSGVWLRDGVHRPAPRMAGQREVPTLVG